MIDLTDEPPADALERWPASVKWRQIDAPPLPETKGSVQIALAADELWCVRCGGNGITAPGKFGRLEQRCTRCGGLRLVAAVSVLQPGEYVLCG